MIVKAKAEEKKKSPSGRGRRRTRTRVVSPYFAKDHCGGHESSLLKNRVVSPYFAEKTKGERKRKEKKRQDIPDAYPEVREPQKPSVRLVGDDDVRIKVFGSEISSADRTDLGKSRRLERDEDEEEKKENVSGEKYTVYFDKVTGCWGCKNLRRYTEYCFGKRNLAFDDGSDDGNDCLMEEAKEERTCAVGLEVNPGKSLDDLLPRFAYKGDSVHSRIKNECVPKKLEKEEARHGKPTRMAVSPHIAVENVEDCHDVLGVSLKRKRKGFKGCC